MPKQFPVNRSLKFTVAAGAPVAEWERLSVTAKLIHKQQIYRGKVEAEKNRGEQNFHCGVEIPQEGYYAVYVQCRGLDIQGSPFKIRMMPAPRPEKVVVSGPGLKGGLVGEKQTFSIDAREAGYGNIQLKVQGEKGGLSIDMHRHESSKHIIIAEYTPEYPGKYTIHVFWAGLAVADSPYSVSVRNSKNGEGPKNKASDSWSIQTPSSQLIEPVH
ncbi:Filamin-C [Geodia barretti]|uniref:Filamin-C n=1 Tax=Geodia barretti TaxID=519541 RepID=A0AA35TKG9_GEOBA|nr:Filamin-C [Geodia barretti]